MSHLRVPSYRLHKPSGKAVVTLDGRDLYLGPWNSQESKAEYDRLVSEWITNGSWLATKESDTSYSIAELALGFLDHAANYYLNDGETTSEYNCIQDALRPLHELYTQQDVTEFGPLALKTVRQKMIDKGWCRQYINRQVNRIRRMFKWGVENELVPAMTLHALQAVAPLKQGRSEAPDSKPIKPVSDEHVEAVLPFFSRQVGAMINLQRLTGARPGEVIQIRPCDIERLEEVWIFRPARHKTKYRGRDREIYLGPQAQAALEPFMDRPAESFCFSPLEAEAERNAERRKQRKTPMTPSQAKRKPKAKSKRAKRERYDVPSYRRAINYGIKKAGIIAWHPNQLRHSCATRTRRSFGIDAAQVILGHKKCDVTQVYADIDREKAIRIVAENG